MKFIRFFAFFLLVITCCTTYGNENKYVFVGQNENDGLAKTAFVLELIGDNLEQYFQINDNGEVCLKLDKIVAIPKETFSHFAALAGSNSQTIATSFLASNQLNENYDELEIRCKNCRFYYTPRPGHRNCPTCGTPN